jgi:hypothetical protein
MGQTRQSPDFPRFARPEYRENSFRMNHFGIPLKGIDFMIMGRRWPYLALTTHDHENGAGAGFAEAERPPDITNNKRKYRAGVVAARRSMALVTHEGWHK